MTALTLYGKKVPTTDSTLLAMEPNSKRRDSAFFTDKECTEEFARIPWHHKNCPISRKRVTFNCYTYDIEWLN